MRKPFHDGGLADARLADQDRIVLGAAGEHLDRAPDLLVAADDRIELALGGGLGEVAGVFLQRIVGLLGAGTVRRAALAQIVDGGVERLRGEPGFGEDAARLGLLAQPERLQHALDGDERIARLLRHLLGLVEHTREGCGHMRLRRAGARHLGKLAERGLGLLQRDLRIAA